MPREKESYNLYPPITVANFHLEKTFCVKYLGAYIDCHLTCHDHIDYICFKISKNINIMVKLKKLVYQKQHLLVCIILSFILSLHRLVHFGEIILMLYWLKS